MSILGTGIQEGLLLKPVRYQWAMDLYEQAVAPKKLIIQRHTTHYEAYEAYAGEVIPQMVEWAQRHLAVEDLEVREMPGPS